MTHFPPWLTCLSSAFIYGYHQTMAFDQLNIKNAFLHSELQEEIYMEQSPKSVAQGESSLICKFSRSLYRLKQSLVSGLDALVLSSKSLVWFGISLIILFSIDICH